MKKIGVVIVVIVAFAAGYYMQRGAKPSKSGVEVANSGGIECTSLGGKTKPMPATKLYVEYNSTDEDTGIHGGFDSSSFAELCIYDPSGKQILAVKPQGQLKELTMAGIFFESREPNHKEVTQEQHFAQFPEGSYSIRAVDFEGYELTGAATLTHTIPAAAVVVSPTKDAKVSKNNVIVSWEPVTTSTKGGAVTITGYEVIVTKDVKDDPHGYSRPTYDVHVPANVTSLPVPAEFLESGSKYELEVLALETSGNQTITVQFFETTK